MEALPPLKYEALKPWFDKQELVLECVKQVQKDLGMFGIELHFSGEVHWAYNELFTQLQPEIERLLHRNSSLQQILYRVDVDEDQLTKVAQENEPFSHSLTRLILWRELQKVVTRFILKHS